MLCLSVYYEQANSQSTGLSMVNISIRIPSGEFVLNPPTCKIKQSIIKYETRFSSKEKRAQLLVKNITEADFAKRIQVTCGSETHSARLEYISPFISEMDNVEGTQGGIEVFKVKSHHNVSVSWYFGNKQINRCAYRLTLQNQLFNQAINSAF